MSDYALSLIRTAKEEKAPFLDLGNTELQEIPEELFELDFIQHLNLGEYYYDPQVQKWLYTANTKSINSLKTVSTKIRNLKSLKTLYLSNNKITDISFLHGLTNLTILSLNNNNIINISFLQGLTNLTILSLNNNNIEDIRFLQRLTKLKTLSLDNNYIKNTSALQGLTDLTTLSLNNNHIKNVSFLHGLTNLTTLSLNNNKITDISFLQRLTNLTALYLDNNEITTFGFLQGPTNLTKLYLNNNYIVNTGFLQRLTDLTILYLSKNNITDISSLQGLTNLTTLFLNNNNIEDISSLQGLTSLTKLSLNNNNIEDISFLEELTSLTTLSLSNNKITDISKILTLIRKGIPVKWKSDTDGIALESNPLNTPPLEVIEQGNEAIINYFDELEKQGSEFLLEAKLLIIGEGGVGKTSLVRKIKDINAPLPEEQDTTKGINIELYTFPTAKGKNFNINIWDFGGQEIYHATHQFFLTKRSLYILVDDTRKDDKSVNDATFNYWLQTVNLYGGNSPLLIVQNEKGDRSKVLDLKGMRERFDFVINPVKTNLLIGRGVSAVKEAIHYEIQRLPHIGEKVPKSWLNARKELAELSKTKDYILLEEYLSICKNHSINEEEKALYLSSYLHDLGTFLHFQDDAFLQHLFILNNQWATTAVYKVLDDESVKKKWGYFIKTDLKNIWSEPKYKHRDNELLALMIKFELCYELKDTSVPTWLAPQLLSVEAPDLNWNYSQNLIIRYTYEFMPKGLLSRFIVRKHQYIKDASMSWRSGVVLERQNTKALITETYGSREIVIRVKGSHPKELMTIVAEDFDQMHSKFENLKVNKLIPCNCSKCQHSDKPNFYEYDDLITRKEKGKKSIECKISYNDCNVLELLDGVFTRVNEENDAPPEKFAGRTLNVFLSYAHKDKNLKEKLNNHLSSLRLNNKIIVWNDREISGGDDWDESIKFNLDKADIILLLISADFISSQYIWNTEVMKAIERHDKKEAKVIPVFLKPCDFEDMPFARLQGYPADAKPVTDFKSRDQAFTQIAQGIRRDIESWK